MNIDPAYFGREREYVHARKLAEQLRRAVRASETGRGYALSYTARTAGRSCLTTTRSLKRRPPKTTTWPRSCTRRSG
jgi:hypothetical protein